MAIGKASDFKVYQDQFKGGIVETLARMSNAFNGASNGAIRLRTASSRGDYRQESFFADADIIARRDTTSVAAVDDIPIIQDELISVKLNRRIGPRTQTFDSFKKILENGEEAASFILGQQAAKRMQVEMLDSGLLAARAALDNVSASTYTVPTNGSMTTAAIIQGMRLMGDAGGDIVAWVMHSVPFYSLITDQVVTSKIDGVSNLVLYGGGPATLGKPVIVTDSASLLVTSGSPVVNDYYTLGLTEGAIDLVNTEEEQIENDVVTGLANLVIRIQGEYAYNVGVKGFKWNTGAGINPSGATLGTGSNWVAVMDSHKACAGFVVQSRES